MNKKAILVACMVAISFGAVVPITLAASYTDVTVEWIVPSDTSIIISFPAQQVLNEIKFDATSVGDKNFTNLPADGQNSTTPAMRITNDGNQALKIEAHFTSDFPTGIEYVNVSIGDNTNSSKVWWTSSNETTNQTLAASLAVSSHEDYWFWTTGHNVPPTTGVTRTLRVWSSAA